MRILFVVIVLSLVWGCKSNQKEQPQDNEQKDLYFLWSVDWHPAKNQFVVGGMQDSLRLFSSKDFQVIKNYPYKGTITKTKWHPSKNILAVSVQDGKSNSTILNFDTNTSIQIDSISKEGARAIGWNHSGELLAVGDYEGFLTIFDETGKMLKKVDTKEKSLIGLDWHPTKNQIVTVGENVILYDYESDDLEIIKDREEKVEVLMLCVAWHPSGKFFVTGDYGDFQQPYPPLLQYWTQDGQRIKSIDISKAEYRNLQWSPDGNTLATASEKIRLWNKDGELIAEDAAENLLWGIDWKSDGSQIVATDEKGNIIFWDQTLNKLKELRH